MKLYLRSIDDLEAILDRFTPYGRTTTSIVHSAPVPTRPLPLTEPADAGKPAVRRTAARPGRGQRGERAEPARRADRRSRR